MASAKPYIGCKIGLISKAQNRYEGILYTIDKINSTVVLANVKCFGTEGRPTDRPTPSKDDVYEYITFRGSDIKDITLCETSRSHGLPPDPAIIQSSSANTSSVYPGLGRFSPLRIPAYNQLAAGSLLNQQYAAAALGLDLHVRRGPMVEKAVQTFQVERTGQRRGPTVQEQQWSGSSRRLQRPRSDISSTPRDAGVTKPSGPGLSTNQLEPLQQNTENEPPHRRRQGTRRRRIRGRGQPNMPKVPSPILKFDSDFDFVSSNAQFMKEELERELQGEMNPTDENDEVDKSKKLHAASENDDSGPKCYYNKAKSFFDNISSEGLSFRLTWAEERKRNLETFGVTGRFFKGPGYRGRYGGQRGRGAIQTLSHRTLNE
ncbi:protein LSM14 homolog B-B isoform X2 [Austrofundulus limnaeus]|uniref:Protein LSM14 homolog B-B isoform X2 n=1 Tax=Austrofundulus limnaeus TaxID=52670 RepID=A0A2I4DA85_AUSLI|nr:PREDICTED: protein LSM14 homolog B isoform X2 [Austrofundulus limnaeus]